MTSLLMTMIIYSCGIVSVFLNGSLILLIALRSVKELGRYKFLLLLYVGISFCFSFSVLCTIPTINTSFGWIFIATSTLFPPNISYHFLFFFCHLFNMLIINLVYSYIYRYFAVCRPECLTWFSKPTKVITLSSFIIIAPSIGTCTLYTFFSPNFEKTNQFNGRLDVEIDINNYGYIGFFFFDEYSTLIVSSAVVVLAWIPILIITISITSYTIFGIYQAISSHSQHLSDKSIKLQRKLFTLLIFQTLDPVLFLFLPASSSYLISFLELDLPHATDVINAFLPFSQVIEPLLILIFIGEYRRSLYKLICGNRNFLQASNFKNSAVSAVGPSVSNVI